MDIGEIEGVILVKSLLLAILEALVGMVSAPAERLDLVLFGAYRSSAVEAMDTLVADPTTWLIQIGTNDLDTLTGPDEADDLIGAVLERVDPEDRVVWVTVAHAGHPEAAATWNDALRATSGIEVAEWRPRPGWLRDGIHPTPAGRAGLADLYCEHLRPAP